MKTSVHPIMNVHYFVPALTLISFLNLSGCTKVESDQSIALCKEAMELNASQLGVDEQQRNRYIEGCTQASVGRTPEQWQCVLAAMKQGGSYLKATDTCFPK
jgi:hypothetical protein